MRIIARRTLREFAESLAGHRDQPSVKAALDAWFDEAKKAHWKHTAEVKRSYATASIISNVAVELKTNPHGSRYQKCLAEVERLWGAKSGTLGGDRLDVLATLIDAYEAEHHPMDPPDPIEAIKFRMEQQRLTRKDLAPMIGTRTRVAEILNRKRPLSITMIRRLHERLGVSAEVLIRPSRTEKAA